MISPKPTVRKVRLEGALDCVIVVPRDVLTKKPVPKALGTLCLSDVDNLIIHQEHIDTRDVGRICYP
jgi:hypothetical protein